MSDDQAPAPATGTATAPAADPAPTPSRAATQSTAPERVRPAHVVPGPAGQAGDGVPAFVAAVHARDAAAARASISPAFQGKANGRPMDGDAQARLLESFWAGFPDGNFTMDPTGGSGRYVITWTFQGTHGGMYVGVPPTGTPVAFSGYIIAVADKSGVTSLDWKWDTKVFTRAVLGPDQVGDLEVKDTFRDPSKRWQNDGRGGPGQGGKRKKGKGPGRQGQQQQGQGRRQGQPGQAGQPGQSRQPGQADQPVQSEQSGEPGQAGQATQPAQPGQQRQRRPKKSREPRPEQPASATPDGPQSEQSPPSDESSAQSAAPSPEREPSSAPSTPSAAPPSEPKTGDT